MSYSHFSSLDVGLFLAGGTAASNAEIGNNTLATKYRRTWSVIICFRFRFSSEL